MRTILVAATALTTAITAQLVLSSASADPAEPSARTTGSQYDLLLQFDGNAAGTPNLASSGTVPVTSRVASANGGTVDSTRRAGGQAARLEPYDPQAPAPLGVVVVRPDGDGDPFAPRRADFSFGATFNIDAQSQGSDVDNGNNLVQRGLYADDAQYKIQVDNGRVSCRVSGAAGAVFVWAKVSTQAGLWHRVRCVRRGGSVTLALTTMTSDGPVTHRWSRTGATGDLAFAQKPPLSVGGKVDRRGALVESSADQFNGRVDNVFFRRLGG